MWRRKWIASVFLAAIATWVPVLGGWGGPPAAPLVFGLSAEPPNLDPQAYTGTAATTVDLQLYRGLLGYDARGRIADELAQSHAQTGPTTYTFTLRPGLTFSDGSALTPDDVVFSFQRIADPTVGAYLAKSLSIVQAVTAVDAHTVRVVLKAPDAAFLSLLALPQAAVVSKQFTLAHDNNLKQVAMGEGPYQLKSWQHGVDLTVARNPDYWKSGLPKTEEIDFRFYTDDSARVAALQSGAVQIIDSVPWQDMQSLASSPTFGYQGVTGPFMYLLYNLKEKPFDNKLVREAVGYAVDRQAILKTAFFGRGQPLYGLPVPESSFAYDRQLAHYYAYDPAKAKRLLGDAGYPNGITATLLSTATYGMHKDTAQVVQQDLNAIGNHITLALPDWATRVSLGYQGRFQFAVNGTVGLTNDPDFLTVFLSSGAPAYYGSAVGYSDPDVDRLLQAAEVMSVEARRRQLYGQMQQLALADSPYTFLTWREQGYAYSKTVSGFTNLPGFLTFWSGYSLEDTTVTR